MKERKIKRSGLITASPSEFLVHQRLGQTRFLERGRAAWVLPWLDRYALIPSAANSVSFCADQITAENQGVEVSGFAIWSVVNPARAVEAADFTDAAEAICRIGEHLRQVVESAIRHQVANFTLDDSLRKRATIIERLKAELDDVAKQWGLAIATVEIKTVRIMSAQLFENLQARFRDAIRLESERSAIATAEVIDRERAEVREGAARRDLAFKQAEAARAEELERAEVEREAAIAQLRAGRCLEVELAKLGNHSRLTQGREAAGREAIAAETALVALDRQLEHEGFELDQSRAEHRNKIAEIDAAIERRRIEVVNTKDAARLFLENLPGLLAGMNITNVNLGDPMIAEALGRLARSLTQPNREVASTHPEMNNPMNSEMNPQPYDIIGDIHGYADVLEKLLRQLGYEKPGGIWRHPAGRKVLFLGDFIDRGPSIRRTLKTVRAMVDAGQALAIMGNHEYNALLYHTGGADGDWLRPRTPKNVRQHAVTLAQFWDHRDEWVDHLAWFATLPLWLELGGLRAVHANWDDRLVAANPHWRILDEGLLHRSRVRNSPEFEHCEILLKGAEAELPEGCFCMDKERNVRTKMRLRWWLEAEGRTYHQLCMPAPGQTDQVPHEPVPASVQALCPGYPADAPPLFFGHYWLPFEGRADLIAPNVACLDFSVAKDGALAAYRWEGERKLDVGKMVFARENE